jgi:low affinity Fe/Cu permease
MTALTRLSLRGNHFTGTIPAFYCCDINNFIWLVPLVPCYHVIKKEVTIICILRFGMAL